MLWWIFVAIFFYNATAIGQVIFWLPALAFAVGAFATTRLALSAAAPERFTPMPDALRNARKNDTVTAPGHWIAPGEGRPGSAKAGLLRAANGRLSFETTAGETGFDVPFAKISLPTVPGFLRPQLDLDLGAGVHTVRLFPIWDLGATFVGPVVAGEWCRQLKAAGAS